MEEPKKDSQQNNKVGSLISKELSLLWGGLDVEAMVNYIKGAPVQREEKPYDWRNHYS
ncbi:hypothetical protein MUN82_08745 [Hymenobacter aerilatus]|uniref:Uncharacterized protein n=1 Tax=Hymenobacter aerilatus TaxID=2932251 RepID=A0A8T9T3J9_9BACT|nr:hypothetical protein [Hymenobacter aerilatus]UOR07170.1 hypothetical protein MUN82_08745 [Hymenobacter aerilatus]